MVKLSTFQIEDEGSLKEWIEKSDDMLLIFDIHLAWTGRCEVLTPSFDQTYVNFAKADERFVFLAMEGPRFADLFETLVTFSESSLITLDDFFQVENGGNHDNGAADDKDLPLKDADIRNSNSERMKTLLRKEGKGCSPLFLAVKGRKITSIVEGASFPAVLSVITDQIPKLSEDEK